MYKPTAFLLLLGLVSSYPDPDSRSISQDESTPIVTTPLGSVKGSVLVSRLGKPIYSFRGLRYAKPPINEHRFQPPIPIEKWEGVLNASQNGPSCPQQGVIPVSEDCLLLNVYTTKLPKAADNPKRPTLVFFHQGDFCCGTSDSETLGPKYLLDEELVLVTVNYRLGSLGFLSTGDKEAPGNNGLKDQVEALKWVQENIVSFGGDPTSVTIAGHGAGAVSVTLHLVSPLSKGLFHRAIAMSGSDFGNWPINTNQLDLAKKQAKLLSCPDDTSANIVKCLKGKPVEDFIETIPKLKEFGAHFVWLPVMEKETGIARFLPAHPIELIHEDEFSKVPFLTGITTDEFAKLAFETIKDQKMLQDLDKNFEKLAPILFMYEKDTDNSKTISKELKKFYFDNKPLDNSQLGQMVNLYSDALIGFGVNRGARLISEKAGKSVFYYRFNYKGRHSNFYLPDSNNTNPYGVAHGDDLIYLFNNVKNSFEYRETDPEIETVEKLTKLWANFVKSGKPIIDISDKLDSVKWEPFTTKSKKYMEIGNKLILNENLYEKRYAEWERLFPVSAYQLRGKKHG